MFVRNFLSAGDYMEVVPIGVPLTLQYDVNGILEKVLFRYENDSKDVTDVLKSRFISEKVVPRKVSVKTGTTWVVGVLYTEDHPDSVGSFPDDMKDEYISSFVEDPSRFKFYAGNVRSMSTVFRGAVPTRQWLTMSGFNVLPGYVVPSGLTEANFDKLILNRNFPFKYPLFQGYFIFKMNDVTYYDLGFTQRKVSSCRNCLNDEGHVQVEVTFDNGDKQTVDYSEYVRMNLQNGVLVTKDESNKIIFSVDPKSNRKTLASKSEYKMTCPVCGKIYTFNPYNVVVCPDSHCNSRLYPSVTHFLSVLGLDPLSKSEYDSFVTAVGKSFSVPDVLDHSKYENIKLSVRISKLLRALVPESVVSGVDGLDSFCNRCNNVTSSVLYYVDNPDKANKDLRLYESSTSYTKLLSWLSDKENVMDIHSLLMNPKITITEANMTIPDAAPIFRGSKILLLGRFLHGSMEQMDAILSSYGATVVTRYSDDVSFAVVGDTKENISGPAANSALRGGKIIYEEHDFFHRFELDKDLRENL